MARPPVISDDDRRIWTRVTGTVTPPRARKADRVRTAGPVAEASASPVPSRRPVPVRTGEVKAPPAPVKHGRTLSGPLQTLEPRRQRRLSRERDPIEARIDLHGHGRFQAQDALTAFLLGAHARGLTAVLVITGQGRRGGSGVIRASVPDWLRGPALRPIVSGHATAHRRHGGDGALYVTLKRRG